MQKNYWLLKTEPDTFSIDDLASAKNQTTSWEGVRNYQARNYLRQMRSGDLAFFYHSSCAIPAIMGIVTIIHPHYPDPTAFDPRSPYFDPKSSPENPRWFTVDVQLKKKLSSSIPLSIIKQNSQLENFPLVQRGSRLSVIPVRPSQWEILLTLHSE
jgi:predicted RNA-binding protein with PUA-like domain